MDVSCEGSKCPSITQMTKNQTVEVDFEDASDDYDIAEANCELAIVEGQLCNIPYELYDLPDLTGILSIETWNSVLTDEERFFLSCFLPDMDEQTFNLTMLEVLGGANLYFGNPKEDKFYKELRGGLFTPTVACCKEGVMFFKRKRYYYYLEFYHEKLIKTFTEMQRLWVKYGDGLGNTARLLLWSGRTRTGNLKLLDLNRVPSEELDSVTCRSTTFNVLKPVVRTRMKNLTSLRSGSSNNSFKIKITKKGKLPYQGSGRVSSKHHHRTLQKGLLKVIPKSSSAIFREPFVAPDNSPLKFHETGSNSNIFAASPCSGTRFKKPCDRIACSITDLPKCLLNHQDTSFNYLETTQRSSIEETEPVLHEPTHTIPIGLGASNYSITEHNLPTKQDGYVHYHLQPPSFKPGMVDRASETTETERILSGKNFQRETNVLRKPLRVLSKDNHTRKTDGDHLFSLTYKRRKCGRNR